MPKGVPNKRYTPEFKRMVVETMKKEHLSIYAAMQEFGINDHKIIERWERIYLEEGPEGLSVERRGRSSTGRSKKLPKEVEEDLPLRRGQERAGRQAPRPSPPRADAHRSRARRAHGRGPHRGFRGQLALPRRRRARKDRKARRLT